MKNKHEGAGKDRKLHDPVKDKLSPVFPLDLSKAKNISDLVRGMADTAFTGRQLGEAADVLEAMARDKDCFVVMTLAGAMTVAKMGLVIAPIMIAGYVIGLPYGPKGVALAYSAVMLLWHFEQMLGSA